MKKILTSLLLIYISFSSFSQNKRGLAYGNHSSEDIEVLTPSVSWWYNWSETPEDSVSNVFTNYDIEFVPMTWNGNFDEDKLTNFLSNHPETKYLLAFNEPNFIEQANMTPTQVAAMWPVLESIADTYDLKIVGPAVNFCGNCVSENGTTYYSPFDYLDDFFAACQGCRVDYIAIHSYMNNIGSLNWYLNEFKSYGKPIWITEFAGWEENGTINNLSDQINFMIGAVDLFESDTSVYKYSWFIGRGSGINTYPFIDILGDNGELTELGEIYTQMPVHDVNNIVYIPAKIEAENYNSMQGILLEQTHDDSGFANVGYIDSGDWLEYKINVPAADSYTLSFRVASTTPSSIKVIVDGNEMLTQNFTNNNGWQNWHTYNTNIALEEGIHTIRLEAITNGFNINWFQIGENITEVINTDILTNPCEILPIGLFVDDIINNKVNFNWSAPSSAPSYYMIRYRPVGTNGWTVMSAGPQNDVPFTGTSRTRYFMEPGTTYQWNIRARVVDENGATVCQSPWSASHQYTTLPACANLTDLSVNPEANLVYFNANKPSGDWGVWQAKGKIREVGSNNYRYLATTEDSYTNQIKYNFTPSTDYEWHTKAWCTGNVDEDGNSDPQYHSGWGEFSAFTTQDPCDKLPTNLSTTSGNNANTAITMSWDTPTSGQPHHYFLELTNETTGQVFSWNNLAGSSTSKTKYGQSSGDQFKWRIRGACGENGTSWATSFTGYEYYTLGGDRLGNDSQLNSKLTNISVYPNPSRGEFNISFDLESRQDVYLSITNYLGEVIFTEELKDQEGQYNKTIDLGNKANGIYMLNITTNNQNINQRIVIQ